MKRWQAILAQIGIVVGLSFLGRVPLREQERTAIEGAAALLAGVLANQTSKSNPDGTSAQKPYVPK